MEVLEQGEKIVFLRRLKEGPAAESYGIHVAMLAGLSQKVLERAGQIMELLKTRDADLTKTFGVNHDENKVNGKLKQLNKKKDPRENPEPSLFD